MHESGVVYNNLKSEHILIGDSQFSQKSRDQIILVDFSKAKEILDENGKTIKNDGNIYKDQEKMDRLYQKRTDILAL